MARTHVVCRAHGAVPLVGLGPGLVGAVDRDHVEVGAQSVTVGVLVREQAAL